VLLIICRVVKSHFLLSSAEKNDDFEITIFGACISPSRDRVIFLQAQFDVPRIGNFWIQDGFIDYEFTLSNQPRTTERWSDICDWRFIFTFRASVNLVLETVRFSGCARRGYCLRTILVCHIS